MTAKHNEKLTEMGLFLKTAQVSDTLKRKLSQIIAAGFVNLSMDDFEKLCENIKTRISSLERRLN